ncbi:hydrocephalus-inducing protein homolog [Colletes gigas]|uniref:hydrocephalus-inducing protein homolog n=1 Tax=Colletes gigas TaxID=935657 RepID=UPI001C9B528C|nr:hydrocephalus-inducing protein homolog [Colletes gigas]
MGLETQIVSLTGHGVEKSLSIIEPVVQFLPTVPFTEIQETVFTIRNACNYPVEFFWHHLDNSFQAEDKVINALLDYYQVKEILLPPRKPGEPFPPHLINFYNDLVDGTSLAQSEGFAVEDENEVQLGTKANYADSLKDTPYFRDKTRDPVGELFEGIERKSDPLKDLPDPTKPERKVCIIFHGAPFTEYQETACRSARTLNVPTLSIDKAITEAIALGESPSSITIRQIIDDAYQNYIEAYERHKERLAAQSGRKTDEIDSDATRSALKGRGSRREGTKSSVSEKSTKTEGTPRKGKTKKLEKTAKTDSPSAQNEVTFLRLREEPDPLIEFNKIPATETMEILDPLSRYEYKVQAILQLEKIIGPRTIANESPRNKISVKTTDKSARRRKGTSFLGMESDLLAEALSKRLSAADFKRGFVLQSLGSNFLRGNVVENLIFLLRIVGHAEYFLFVTFLNSMANYDRKVDELRQEYGNIQRRYCRRHTQSEIPSLQQRERPIIPRGFETSTTCRCPNTICSTTRIRRCIWRQFCRLKRRGHRSDGLNLLNG